MFFTTGDRTVLLAALKWAAMAYDRKAKTDAAEFRAAEAKQAAAFSQECARLAAEIEKA